MSRPPKFDDSALAAVMHMRPPLALDRAGRVKLLAEFCKAGLTGKEPSRESMVFVAGAVDAWLTRGGSLEREYLQVTARPGSHETPHALWTALLEQEACSRGAQEPDDDATMPPCPSEIEK